MYVSFVMLLEDTDDAGGLNAAQEPKLAGSA